VTVSRWEKMARYLAKCAVCDECNYGVCAWYGQEGCVGVDKCVERVLDNAYDATREDKQ